MSTILRARRKRALIVLGGAAAALLVLSAVSSLGDGRGAVRTSRMGQPVIEGFASLRADASEIRVQLADESYTLLRTARGWTMKESGGYPVRPDRLARLATGLETLSWGEGRTSDPAKFDRIGLGDPRGDGTGALLTLIDSEGEISAQIITGRKGDYLYVREPDGTRAFRAEGDLPPLYTRDAWLDLDIIDINTDAVSAVRLTDEAGNSLYLKRSVGGSSRSFRPGPPYQDYRLVSRIAASTPALALTRLAPIDVKPAAELTTAAVARHITETHDGLEVDLKAYREPDGFYVTLRAIEAGEGARRGSTINEKASDWAFRLTEYDWAEFTPSVNSIVRKPANAGN
jgi:hypothetical protein